MMKRGSSAIGKTFFFLAAVFLVCIGTGRAKELSDEERAEQYRRQKFYQPGSGYEQEPEYTFEGVIIKRPADSLLGIWIIDDRQIVVSPLTRIKEEHGKAAAGAKVKVRGVLKELDFMATEVEVKAAGQP